MAFDRDAQALAPNPMAAMLPAVRKVRRCICSRGLYAWTPKTRSHEGKHEEDFVVPCYSRPAVDGLRDLMFVSANAH